MPKDHGFIGKRVRVISEVRSVLKGRTGTVVYYDLSKEASVLVEFDSKIPDGHSGNTTGLEFKDGHCWWMRIVHLEAETEDLSKVADKDSIHLFSITSLMKKYKK